MNNWIVCYTRELTNTKTGEEKREDEWMVFLAWNSEGEDEARRFYEHIKSQPDTYSATLCKIVDSTEPHYLEL